LLDYLFMADTVLTWTMHEGDEAALSFEDVYGCEEFWRLICRFQGRPDDYVPPTMHTDEIEDETIERTTSPMELSDTVSFQGLRDEPMYSEVEGQPETVEVSFPEKPDYSNLSDIEDALNQSISMPLLRRRIGQVLLEYQYVPILLSIFQECEHYGRTAELALIFRIFKCIFMLNSQDILKVLMSDEYFLLVANVFEHDPAFKDTQADFRSFLVDPSHFKQVVPIHNDEILALIHQTFRLQYFKDVVLARILDEESSASFILTIRLNHMVIVNALDNDPEVTEVVQHLLQQAHMPAASQLQLLRFFKEFLMVAKTVTLRRTLQVYQAPMMTNFLKFLNAVLHERFDSEEASVLLNLRLLAVELLISFIQHDATAVRAFFMQKTEGANLLSTVIELFLDVKCESSIRWQTMTALRALLDTFNPAGLASLSGSASNLNALTTAFLAASSPQVLNQALSQKSSEDFLNFFYPDYACRLFKPIIDLDKTVFAMHSAGSSFFLGALFPEASAEILFHLCELLCSCIGQHKYRIKYLILRNLVLQNTLLLLRGREKFLQLSALRVFRSTLGTGDEFYYRFFIQHRSFAPIFEFYRHAGGASVNNLVTSSVLEMFEHLRTMRPVNQDIVRHLATFHKADLECQAPEAVFRGMLELADRIERGLSLVDFVDEVSSPSPSPSLMKLSMDEISMPCTSSTMKDEQTEEDYFSSMGEEDSSAPDLHAPDHLDDFDPPQFNTEEDEDDALDLLQRNRSAIEINCAKDTPPAAPTLPSSPTKKTKY